MNTYADAVALLAALPIVTDWPELHVQVARAASRRPRAWELPLLGCQAVGGDDSDALPAVAALGCLQLGIILIDDLLDEDPRGEHHRIGAPAAANLAAGLQAAALEAVAMSDAAAGAKLDVLAVLNRMALATAHGQHLDTRNPSDEAGYWRLVRAKSSPYFGAALYAGARLGGATDTVALQLDRLGRLYGEMIQIHDDLNDTMATPANPDWTLGRFPLPILFAHVVDHPERARFAELRTRADDPAALAEAQAILIRCGAVAYCVDALLARHDEGRRLLAAMPLVAPAPVKALMEEIMAPVRRLLASAGAVAASSTQAEPRGPHAAKTSPFMKTPHA